MAASLKVAVIGAGVAGMTAARELERESHEVVVFEKSHRLGGTWVYDPRVESDLLGVDPNRDIVHGSMYKSLQTNFPREFMSFTDFKFEDKQYGDPRKYPGHEEVVKFLEDFASSFELTRFIRFNTAVTRVEVIDSSGITEFVVESETGGVSSVEVFDAIVICNGHNTEPRLATDIPVSSLHTLPPSAMAASFKVAIIGAGVAGLTAAREIQRESHKVVVFEKSHRIGGTWAYDPRVESDLLGVDLDPNRDIIHGSMYKSLQTNLPRELMSFTDFKFKDKQYGDPRKYPGHEEVVKFLEDFACNFELTGFIRFNTEVTRVEVVESSGITEFVVESETSGVSSVEVFDAVVICNGHNTEPCLATDIPGIEMWSIKQMHSHNYREPQPFHNQIVVIIGSGPSAMDLSKEISMVAKEVHMSSRSPHVKVAKSEKFNNMWQHSKIKCVNKDGKVTFEDGISIEADIIFHCTGYKFHFPFLKTNGIVNVHNKRIGPLYKHVFPPHLAPRLSFVGIPEESFTFLIIECQSRWIAHTLSGKVSLPSKAEMLSDVEKYYLEMEEKGIPEQRTHYIGFQVDYINWMCSQSGMVMEKQEIEMLGYFVDCLMSAGLDGYMDAFSKKYGK